MDVAWLYRRESFLCMYSRSKISKEDADHYKKSKDFWCRKSRRECPTISDTYEGASIWMGRPDVLIKMSGLLNQFNFFKFIVKFI